MSQHHESLEDSGCSSGTLTVIITIECFEMPEEQVVWGNYTNPNSNPSGPNSGSGGPRGGIGSVIISPYDTEDLAKLDGIATLLNLSRVEKDRLYHEYGIFTALWEFLEDDASDEAQAFGKEAIEALKDNNNDGQPDGEVDFPNAIILDSTLVNNQKIKCIYEKLKSLSNTLFKDIIDEQFGSSTENHVKITLGNMPAQMPPGTVAFTYTTYDANSTNPLNSGDIKHIRIDPNFVANASTLSIAKTIIHEFIHAELLDRCIKLGLIQGVNTLGYTVLNSNPTINTIPQAIFNQLLIEYNAYLPPPNFNSQWNHDLFNALNYRTELAQNLESIHPLLNSTTNDFLTSVNNDPYIVGGPYTLQDLMNYISWGGLEGTEDYNTTISNDPTKLAKQQYIGTVLETKYTHTCN